MLDSDVFDFIERSREYKAAADLLHDLRKTIRHFGFENFILSGVPVGGQKLAPMVERMGWPAGWFERYAGARYAEVDGVCLYSARTHSPFYWSDVPRDLGATSGSVRVANEATEFNIRSGFAVPLMSVHHWQSVLSLASPARDCKLSKRETAQIVTLATCTGFAVSALAFDTPEHDPLTDREKEVLTWAAAGKGSWEIAEILGIGERTVVQHTENARRKFGVAKTVQAVVEAIRRRIIHP